MILVWQLCMHLFSLNLEHNSLSSFSGLVYLNKLKVSGWRDIILKPWPMVAIRVLQCTQVLCLNHNRIECLQQSCREPLPPSSQVLNSLEVLHLAYNGIVNLVPLQLGRISSLRALFLQGTITWISNHHCLTSTNVM